MCFLNPEVLFETLICAADIYAAEHPYFQDSQCFYNRLI